MSHHYGDRRRSTCYTRTVHGDHNWDKGYARLWCPGTDGSNPQIPPVLKAELRKLSPAEVQELEEKSL